MFFLVNKLFTNTTLFCWGISIYYLLIYWFCMMVLFLTVSYAAAWRTIFLYIFFNPLFLEANQLSSVLVSSTSIDAMVWSSIQLLSLAVGPEENWMEESHAWVLLVKLGLLVGGTFSCTRMSLMVFLEETLHASNASTNMYFMWWSEILLSHTSAYSLTFICCHNNQG